MRPETEGKIIVALIISLIAFGCGSGVGIVIAISQNNSSSPLSLNYTEQNPQFPAMTPVSTDVDNSQSPSQNNGGSEEVYVENPDKTYYNNTDVNNNSPP